MYPIWRCRIFAAALFSAFAQLAAHLALQKMREFAFARRHA